MWEPQSFSKTHYERQKLPLKHKVKDSHSPKHSVNDTNSLKHSMNDSHSLKHSTDDKAHTQRTHFCIRTHLHDFNLRVGLRQGPGDLLLLGVQNLQVQPLFVQYCGDQTCGQSVGIDRLWKCQHQHGVWVLLYIYIYNCFIEKIPNLVRNVHKPTLNSQYFGTFPPVLHVSRCRSLHLSPMFSLYLRRRIEQLNCLTLKLKVENFK